ncbi:hypothetical protein DFJ74DRAFT_714531 [Hyaloraphidium curvatum]|nr:hypothetical protein DFJ74DRAFT_714531 [Hyaloraphidium curvatum]
MSHALSPAEWAAVFPADASPGGTGGLAPYDPAAELRAAEPLTPPATLALLRPVPLASFLLKVQIAVAGRAGALMGAVLSLTSLIVPLWTLLPMWLACNGGRFAGRELAVATACVALTHVCGTWLLIATPGFVDSYRGLRGKETLGDHAFAVLARWLQLVSADSPTSTSGDEDGAGYGLVAHRPDDRECTCPRKGCSGSLPAQAAVSTLMLTLYIVLYISATSVLSSYSSTVSLARCTWTTLWTATLGGVFYVAFLLQSVSLAVNASATAPSLGSMRLQARLLKRAARICVDRVMEPFRAAVAASAGGGRAAVQGPGTAVGGVKSVDDTEERLAAVVELCGLHRSATETLSQPPYHLAAPYSFAAYVVSGLVAMLVEILAAGCLPLSSYTNILFMILGSNAVDLVNLAVYNGTLTGLLDVYARAGEEARTVLAVGAAIPGAAGAAFRHSLAPELDAVDKLLASFAEIGRHRARFAGFVITGSVVRSYFTALLTAVLGLASVLHNFGVPFTAETACPVQ